MVSYMIYNVVTDPFFLGHFESSVQRKGCGTDNFMQKVTSFIVYNFVFNRKFGFMKRNLMID